MRPISFPSGVTAGSTRLPRFSSSPTLAAGQHAGGQHGQRQHGRLAIANRADKHHVQQRQVHRRQPGQHVGPTPARVTPHADQRSAPRAARTCHEHRQPHRPAAQRRLVGPDVPDPRELDPRQLGHAARIGPWPTRATACSIRRSSRYSNVSPAATARGALLGAANSGDKAHVAAAVGRGAQVRRTGWRRLAASWPRSGPSRCALRIHQGIMQATSPAVIASRRSAVAAALPIEHQRQPQRQTE